MQTYQLSDFISLSQAQLRLPFHRDPQNNKQFTLENESAAILFENIQLKLEFYRALGLQNSTEFTSESDHPKIMFVECAGNCLKTMFSEFKGTYFSSCYTPDKLIEFLEEIPQNNNKEAGKCQLKTLIIDNLSGFYWENKQKPRHVAIQWYVRLIHSIHALMSRYKCNVIFTMWDKQFERGFNSRPPKDFTPHKLDDMTYTPCEFFEGVSLIIACRKTGILRFSDSKWGPLTHII